MTREAIIKKIIQVVQVLPEDKATEISDFADFLLKKYEDLTLQQGIQHLQSNSESFSFLNEDENLYSPADLKEK